MTEHDDADLIERIHQDVHSLRIRDVSSAAAVARGRTRRRAASVRTTLVVVLLAAAVIVPIKLLSSLGADRGGGPAGQPDIPVRGASAWPDVLIGDPRRAYVDRGNPDIDGSAHVLASGTVAGSEFSFLGYTSTSPHHQGGTPTPCIEIAGPADPAQSGGVGGWCVSPLASEADAGWPPFPKAAEILLRHMVGGGEGICRSCVGPERQPVEMGFVTERVTRLEVVLDNGSVHDVPVLDWPNLWHFKSFVFFPSSSYEVGLLLAYDADGQLLAQAALCGPDTGTNRCDMSPTDQIAPMPSP